MIVPPQKLDGTRWRRLWPHVTEAEWADWRWQFANRVRDLGVLGEIASISQQELGRMAEAIRRFPLAVTPYYLSLMDPDDPRCPIRQQATPRGEEIEVAADEHSDPLAEEEHMPVAGLTHRYPDRVLIYTTHLCPVYCRHCNRRRKVGVSGSAPNRHALTRAVQYVASQPRVRDVVLSGGDPLCWSDRRLEQLLRALRAIPHVEIVRLATRCPVTLPQRITPALVEMLARYHPIFLMTHFNHPVEGTPEAAAALARLANGGCVLSNQMVLLRGLNDQLPIVRRLNQWLLAQRCRPYYIFQCDPAQGIRHFRAPIQRGLDILAGIRGHTSGLAVPHYVVDLPGGGGKVPLQPEYLVRRDGNVLTFRNYQGGQYTYVDYP